MKTAFKLIGLSAENRCTLSVDGTGKDWFHAPTNLPRDRFQALFKLFKDGPDDIWKANHQALIEHKGFHDSGKPIDPVVVELIID